MSGRIVASERPRQDLRLLGPALGAWAGAWCSVVDPALAVVLAVGAASAALVVLGGALVVLRRGGGSLHRRSPWWGMTARGMTARGMTARGMTARGMTARGNPPRENPAPAGTVRGSTRRAGAAPPVRHPNADAGGGPGSWAATVALFAIALALTSGVAAVRGADRVPEPLVAAAEARTHEARLTITGLARTGPQSTTVRAELLDLDSAAVGSAARIGDRL